MYATIGFTVDQRDNVLMIPTTALVDIGGEKGVFVGNDTEQGMVASFKKVEVGLVNQDFAEVTSGLAEGDTIVTTGAAALREGDRILLPGESGGRGGAGGREGNVGAGAGGGPEGGGRAGAGRGQGGGRRGAGQGEGQRGQ